MMALYSGIASPCGQFASQLERDWSKRFAAWGWEAKYIGSTCYWADFDVDGVKIEIKPSGIDFIKQAAKRGRGTFLIVEGAPGFERWWLRQARNAKSRVQTTIEIDAPLRIPGKYPTRPRTESASEFMARAEHDENN